MILDTKDILTLLGIGFSFIVGATGLIIGLRNSKKTIFINSVTTSRLKYIQDIRNSIAEYCGLFYGYSILVKNSKEPSKEKMEILKKLDNLKYQIMLYLNPEDQLWDRKMITLIDEIRVDIENNPETKINELIIITQYLLKLEWEGVKLESINGIISTKEKKRLNKKYYTLYLDSIKLQAV